MPGAQFQVSIRKCSEISSTEQDAVRSEECRLRGKHKLPDQCEQDIFVVVSRAGEVPVYRVKPEDLFTCSIETFFFPADSFHLKTTRKYHVKKFLL